MILYSSIPVRNISAKSGQKMDLGHFVRILGQFSGQKRSDLLLTSIKNNIPRPGGKHFSDGRGTVALSGKILFLKSDYFVSPSFCMRASGCGSWPRKLR